jgi:hypothetical protein
MNPESTELAYACDLALGLLATVSARDRPIAGGM